jgi:hypothetical protein
MKKPDSLQNQLKTIQSERNLARGSKKEFEGGAIKPDAIFAAAAVGTDWEYKRGSVSEVAAVVSS